MLVRVTESDIENAERRHPWNCPVARALNNVLNRPTAVINEDMENYVFKFRDEYEYGQKPIVYSLPLNVCKFIDDFDADLSVQPFEFELNM